MVDVALLICGDRLQKSLGIATAGGIIVLRNDSLRHRGGLAMLILSLAYRFASNFILLAMAYFSMNLVDKYDQRALLAMLIMLFAASRIVSALRMFHFYGRVEQLEGDFTKVLGALEALKGRAMPGIIKQVSELRHHGEMKAYLDLFFLSVIIIVCVARLLGK